ncbi:NINE protein [Phormidium sp. FACHB-592]|uniref:NINE protein n=1 Tax=Stenomitos frigidus AS-A4 TaxID=2933935 RepID=A0ABV0KMB4_9CYAN
MNSSTAYVLWFLWLFGLGGAQRLYTGHIGSGLIYLFTWGLFGFGQVIDLALIPGMVEKRNASLRGLYSGTSTPKHSITLNIGDIPLFEPLQAAQPSSSSSVSPMHKLLKAAKANGGQLSLAQAAMHTELAPDQVKELLQEAVRVGYAEITNDSNTGAIRYYFDV